MKFAVKALLPSPTPCLDRLSLQYPNAFVAPTIHNYFLCKTINSQLPSLHNISFVLTNNRSSTFFWLDTGSLHNLLKKALPFVAFRFALCSSGKHYVFWFRI